jgi:hypothetical protein
MNLRRLITKVSSISKGSGASCLLSHYVCYRWRQLASATRRVWFDEIVGSQTGLVIRIMPSRRLLDLASSSRAFAMIRATISRSQADLILFLITKRVREPGYVSVNGRIYILINLSFLAKI